MVRGVVLMRNWLKGKKTRIFNAISLLLVLFAMPEVQALVPEDWLPIVIAAIPVGNYVLYEVTRVRRSKEGV